MNESQKFLNPPPRYVPLALKIKVLFGGFFSQFGWMWLGFSLIFMWVFPINIDYLSWWQFRNKDNIMVTKGILTREEKTKFTEGGDDNSNGTPVYALHYSYEDSLKNQYKGVSYKVGSYYEAKSNVEVEYLKNNPATSRIQGLRRKPMPVGLIFIFLFPLLGLAFIIGGMKQGFKGFLLLSQGKLASGKIKSKIATNTRINNEIVYKMTFEFIAEDGRTYEAITNTHTPELLEDDEKEKLLYAPLKPTYAVMIDTLPGSPRIDNQGSFLPGNIFQAGLYIALPLLTIVIHAVIAYYKFLK
jgi:hypothetical protein